MKEYGGSTQPYKGLMCWLTALENPGAIHAVLHLPEPFTQYIAKAMCVNAE